MGRSALVLGACYAVTLAFLGIVAWQWYSALQQNADEGRWVIHTQAVLDQLDELKSALSISESVGRCVAIDGDPDCFRRQTAALSGLDSQVQSIARLTADNPKQQVRARLLILNVRSMDRSARRPVPLWDPAEVPKSFAIPPAWSSVSVLLEQMNSEEHRLRNERRNAWERSVRTGQWMIPVIFLGACLPISVGGLVSSSMLRRLRSSLSDLDASEQTLRQLNRELEEQVAERTRKLEQTVKGLEAFSYSASHDLRAPLRAVVAFSQILSADHGKEFSPESRDYLEEIRSNAEKMGRLIDGLLILSRATRHEIRVRDVPLDAVVQSALEQAGALENARRFEMRIAPLPTVRGDYVLLHQALVNLLSNALKYSRNMDPAIVEVGVIREGKAESAAGDVTIFVRDNGAGFDPHFGAKLFQPFQRLHDSRDFEGTGLGLSIVARIVERLGGRVWAEGQPGKGATFYFTIREAENDGSSGD